MPRPLPEILAELRASLSEHCPGALPKRLTVEFHNADPFSLPLNGAPAPTALPPVVPAAPPLPDPSAVFIPSDFQARVLAALEGRALRGDDLGAAAGDRRQLYRHPGGLKELRDRGLVGHHQRLGYFRPDAPPAELCPRE